MCLIIDRNAGVKIPLDMLKTACDINQHGYGVSFMKKEKGETSLRFIKKVKPDTKNDPKEIHDLLNELRSHRVFLHIRHSTVGAITEDNAHPFFPLVRATDGVDLGFMHNGTLYDWKPTDTTKSDSRNFAFGYMKPLAERCAKFVGPGKVIQDNFFRHCIEKAAGTSSIFLIFDNFGNVFRVNEKNGKQHEGWWCSNEYSFNTSHHRSSYYKGRTWNTMHGCWEDEDGVLWDTSGAVFSSTNNGPDPKTKESLPWEESKKTTLSRAWETWEDDLRKQDAKDALEAKKNSPASQATDLLERQMHALGYAVIFTKEIKESVMVDNKVRAECLALPRKSFIQQGLLKDLHSVGRLTILQLEDMSFQYPKAMAQLVIDLLAELPPKPAEKDVA